MRSLPRRLPSPGAHGLSAGAGCYHLRGCRGFFSEQGTPPQGEELLGGEHTASAGLQGPAQRSQPLPKWDPGSWGTACSPQWQPHLGGSCRAPSSHTICRATSGPRRARPEHGTGAWTPRCLPVPSWAPLLPFVRFHTAAAICSPSFWGGVSRHWGQQAT